MEETDVATTSANNGNEEINSNGDDVGDVSDISSIELMSGPEEGECESEASLTRV